MNLENIGQETLVANANCQCVSRQMRKCLWNFTFLKITYRILFHFPKTVSSTNILRCQKNREGQGRNWQSMPKCCHELYKEHKMCPLGRTKGRMLWNQEDIWEVVEIRFLFHSNCSSSEQFCSPWPNQQTEHIMYTNRQFCYRIYLIKQLTEHFCCTGQWCLLCGTASLNAFQSLEKVTGHVKSCAECMDMKIKLHESVWFKQH